MSVTLINLPGFIEQIGCRTVQEKPNSLDTIDSIFLGPASMAKAFLPAPRTPHPDVTHPLMLCSRSEIVTQNAALAEVRVSYVGKLNGSGIYVGTPTIDPSQRIGAISYTTTYSISSSQLATACYTVRYTSHGVSFRYLTNSPDAARFTVQAQPYLGTSNLMTFQSAPITYSAGTGTLIAGVWGGYLTNTLVWQNDLTDFSPSDLDNGWFNVVESFWTQPYINSSVA